MQRRHFAGCAAAATLAAATLATGALAESHMPTLTVGAVAPKTGPLAGGATVTYWPNVRLWVEEVNASGGLTVDGAAHMLELIEYDDQTNPGETIRAVQRLATQDEADIILPPYSTGLNLAAAPIFARFGYPMITATATVDDPAALVAQFPNVFVTLGGAAPIAQGAVEVLTTLRERGDIGNRVAMVNVADAFGIELAESARPALEEAGFEIVYDTSYPLGTQDLSTVVKGAADAEPDAFVAFSYPPDTFALTEQAQIEGLRPGAFYTAVATAFPSYQARFGDAVEGTLGIGGVDADSQAFQDYAARHEEVTGEAPDYWASAVVYSTFQVLQQSIEAVGTLDNEAIVQHVKDNAFETVIGTLDFDEDNNNAAFWTVGQWQDGAFVGVASTGREGAAEVRVRGSD